MHKHVFAFSYGLLIAAAAVSAAQDPKPAPKAAPAADAYRYRILGVYDEQTGEPLEGVEVADVFNGNKSLTTKTGTVSLYFLPDGGAVVRIRKVGYEVQTFAVSISPADTTPITVTLAHATKLAPVVVKDAAPTPVTAHLADFERRRAAGFGHFMTDSIFRAHENQTLASLIPAHMPGLQVSIGSGGKKHLASGRKQCAGSALSGRCNPAAQPSCYVTVYLDGVKIYDPTMDKTTLPDFERMSAMDYAAAEFYQGADIPPEYNLSHGNADCGVLLLWTRDR